MNVKRAVTTAAGVLGALLLAVVVGLGHVAGHSGSGAGTQARATVTHLAPVKASLTAFIYGDGTSIYGDGSSIYGDGSSSGNEIYGDSSTGTVNGIYGD